MSKGVKRREYYTKIFMTFLYALIISQVFTAIISTYVDTIR